MNKFDDIVMQAKALVKEGKAVVCKTSWTVSGSASKGRKLTNDYIKIVLMVFDTVVERACNYVTANNIENLKDKLYKAFIKINKLSSVLGIEITEDYLKIKLEQLVIIHRYRVAKQEEREKSRAIKMKALEERKEQKRLEAEEAKLQAEIERQRQIDEAVQEEVRKQIEEKQKLLDELSTKGADIAELSKVIEGLKEKLSDTERQKEEAERKLVEQIVDIQDKKETLQAGFVYIISNPGAFGENVFKIGVTRRENPLERVNELSNASVPFKFNVHSIIASEEAFKLEHDIHNRLKRYRVNIVNNHKEFFRIDTETLKTTLLEIVPNLEFDNEIREEQYLETLRILNDPDEFERWLNSEENGKNKLNSADELDDIDTPSRFGVVDAGSINSNSLYTLTDEYEYFYNEVASILEGLSSTPVMRVTKFYMAVYLKLDSNMKKIVTFYKSGDGGRLWAFSILGYNGSETSGGRNSIRITEFSKEKYADIILKKALEIDNQLLDLSDISI